MSEMLLNELKEKAKQLVLKNNWGEESIEVNKKIIELDSKCSAAYTRLVKCYIQKGNIETAVKLCEQVLEFDPKNNIAINRLIEYGNYVEKIKEKKRQEKALTNQVTQNELKIKESKNDEISFKYDYEDEEGYEEEDEENFSLDEEIDLDYDDSY
ncbi:tetratricopeptide repeat protein [Oceanirhabdus sp. W0125-5]|uniref:tetratricopeptide repeat protein n=1 Tax=Oceanirhabdus sp. W0125-5 TaxID=2999116 RepID=UPI0022F2BFFB|nr:tetratricopeptide repeat protein [Oceanirhabdus sp. W0125-5]WBW97081.1 tetratricopeptide repeat protein [Oceanirhabdus sp. W0125-5]